MAIELKFGFHSDNAVRDSVIEFFGWKPLIKSRESTKSTEKILLLHQQIRNFHDSLTLNRQIAAEMQEESTRAYHKQKI